MLHRTKSVELVFENITENYVFAFGYNSRFILATNVRVWCTFGHTVWCLCQCVCSAKYFSKQIFCI